MEKQMTEKDYFDDFRFVTNKLKKRFMFEYNGVKFVSNREIIGVINTEQNLPKIDLKQQPTVVCESCGSMYFKEVVMIKRVSKLFTGALEDTLVPFPTYRCDDCGHVNEDFKLFDK